MVRFAQMVSLVFAASLLSACGGGGGGGGVQSGTFVNAPAQGVTYTTSSGLTGDTDENGGFRFNLGDEVRFSLNLGNGNTLDLGSASAGSEVSVLSLSGNGIDPLAVSQVLQTLDASATSGSMDLRNIELTPGLANVIQAAVAGVVSEADIATIAADIRTAMPSRELKNREGVSPLAALSNLAQQPANQLAVMDRINAGVGGGLISQVEDKPAFSVQTIRENGAKRTEVGFFLLKNSGAGTGDFYIDSDGDDGTVRGNETESGSYTYVVGQNTGNWTNVASDGSGSFIVKGQDTYQAALEYVNVQQSESGAIAMRYILPMQASQLVGRKLVVAKACDDGTDAVLTFSNVAGPGQLEASFTSSCLGSGYFSPVSVTNVFNGYVIRVVGGDQTKRIALVDYRDATGARANFPTTATGKGRFVVINENPDDRDDTPGFFDFTHCVIATSCND